MKKIILKNKSTQPEKKKVVIVKKKKQKAKSNPNKANQHKIDPRQALFLTNFIDPKSETFSNGYRSALKAGYEEEYARVLKSKMPTWLSTKVNELRNEALINKCRNNLERISSEDYIVQAFGAFGPLYEMKEEKKKLKNGKVKIVMKPDLDKPIKKIHTGIMKEVRTVSEFLLETLAKEQFSKRSEHTGKDGEAIVYKYQDLSDEDLKKLAKAKGLEVK